MKSKKQNSKTKSLGKRRAINTNLSTWARQIRKATKKGQTQDIEDWPEFFPEELNDSWYK